MIGAILGLHSLKIATLHRLILLDVKPRVVEIGKIGVKGPKEKMMMKDVNHPKTMLVAGNEEPLHSIKIIPEEGATQYAQNIFDP